LDRQAKVRNGDCTTVTVNFYRRLSGHIVRILGHDFPLARFKNSAVVSEYVDRRRLEQAKDTAIRKEVALLRTTLKLAKERGLWHGDVDAAFPTSFNPEYKPKERGLTRTEFVALVPHLLPDAAAAAAFILATSAEDAALRTALRADLPEPEDPHPRVRVRGTKTAQRDRLVPVVSFAEFGDHLAGVIAVRDVVDFAREVKASDESPVARRITGRFGLQVRPTGVDRDRRGVMLGALRARGEPESQQRVRDPC
jgi:hypothetical protein